MCTPNTTTIYFKYITEAENNNYQSKNYSEDKYDKNKITDIKENYNYKINLMSDENHVLDTKDLVREFRGELHCFNGEPGKRFEDSLPENIEGFRVIFVTNCYTYVKSPYGAPIGTSRVNDDFSNYAIFENVDIRRVIEKYIQNFSAKCFVKVDEISYKQNNKNITLTKIKYDENKSKSLNKVFFKAVYKEKNNDIEYNAKICIPIEIEHNKNDIALDSTNGFYILYKRAKDSDKPEIDLRLGEKCQIRDKEYIDLLYGVVRNGTKVQKGWFYYFKNELKPYCVVERDNDTVLFIYSDPHLTFNNNDQCCTHLNITNLYDVIGKSTEVNEDEYMMFKKHFNNFCKLSFTPEQQVVN